MVFHLKKDMLGFSWRWQKSLNIISSYLDLVARPTLLGKHLFSCMATAMSMFRSHSGKRYSAMMFNNFRWSKVQCPKQTMKDSTYSGHFVGSFIEDLLCAGATKIDANVNAKDEVFATKEEEARLTNTGLEEAESEMHYLKEVIREAKAESMKLQESLTDKENELRSVIQENKELQNTESASVIKVKEWSKLKSSRLYI
ncbi:hypothetical protein DCAR_0934339 [Daucus carota subsp. sativus]|uniref:Uncharacterized protein n=1 Tax=Daucus carota subsp. sativus TaxID=79200 RepID=A0AAF0XUZ9_DAUCS|nr:hypothetical protein DCAR_0934339 [Daucus carota subsp. sativus]